MFGFISKAIDNVAIGTGAAFNHISPITLGLSGAKTYGTTENDTGMTITKSRTMRLLGLQDTPEEGAPLVYTPEEYRKAVKAARKDIANEELKAPVVKKFNKKNSESIETLKFLESLGVVKGCSELVNDGHGVKGRTRKGERFEKLVALAKEDILAGRVAAEETTVVYAQAVQSAQSEPVKAAEPDVTDVTPKPAKNPSAKKAERAAAPAPAPLQKDDSVAEALAMLKRHSASMTEEERVATAEAVVSVINGTEPATDAPSEQSLKDLQDKFSK